MRPYRRFLIGAARTLMGGKTTSTAADGAVLKVRGLAEPELLGKSSGPKKVLLNAPEPSVFIDKKVKPAPSPRPNYFVAIPVNSAQIKEKLEQVQKSMLEFNKKLRSAFVALEKSHITLMVMHLQDEDEIERASTALESVISKLKADGVQDMPLNFEGLGHFRKQVLFAKISEDDGLVKLRHIAAIVRETFTEHGLAPADNRAFQAHLTVAKLSKNIRLKSHGITKIDGPYLRDHETVVFGKEICSKLQLLSMATDKATGYYHCESEIAFVDCITDSVESTVMVGKE